MNTRLARFVIRPEDGTPGAPGNLILGVLMKTQNPDLLRPGVVYEIRETLGELTIVPVGEAAIGYTRRESGINWSQDIGHLLDQSRGRHILTVEEDKERRDAL